MPDDLHALLQKVKDLRSRHERLSAQVTSFTAHTRRLVSILSPAAVETPPACAEVEPVSILEFRQEPETQDVATLA